MSRPCKVALDEHPTRHLRWAVKLPDGRWMGSRGLVRYGYNPSAANFSKARLFTRKEDALKAAHNGSTVITVTVCAGTAWLAPLSV